jgi:hypothetical protein
LGQGILPLPPGKQVRTMEKTESLGICFRTPAESDTIQIAL